MKRSTLILVTLLVLTSMVLAACGATPTATPVPVPPTATKAPVVVPTNTTAPAAAPTATKPAPTNTAVPPTAAPAAKPVKLVIWHGYGGDYSKPIEAQLAEYTKLNPNVTFEFSKPDNLNDALKVAIPAGKGPDIIAWANDVIGTNALAGNIVDLGKYGVDSAFLKSIYEPAAVNGMIWSGKVWGLPETQEGIAFVYNKDLVTEKYLPTKPGDFADLLAKAKLFAADNPGKFLLCNQGLGNASGDAYHAGAIWFGFGMPAYVDDAGKVYFNTPEALSAAKWMVEFSKVAPKETSHDICKANLIDKKVGAWWTGPWAIADLEAAKINYGILPLGKPFVGIKTVLLTSNAVSRGSDVEAVKFMKWYTSAAVQKTLALANKTVPAQTAAVNDPAVKALTTVAAFAAALNLGIPSASTPYAGAQWDAVGNGTTAIWNGKVTPEQGVKDIQTAIETKVKEMK